MSLLLCRKEPVRHPFSIDVLGLSVYSSQELCYVICHHPLLVMENFVDQTLFDFIRSDLGLGALAGRMERLAESGARSEEILYLYLKECDYCTEEEIRQFRRETAEYRSLPRGVYQKTQADGLFELKQYGRAVKSYEALAAELKDAQEDQELLVQVLANLGAAYAQMFRFHKAYQTYDRAYSLAPDQKLLRAIYMLTCVSPELSVRDTYLSLFNTAQKAVWDQEIRQAQEAGEQAIEVRSFRAVMMRKKEKRLEGVAEMIEKWKQEYRLMI